MMSYDRDAPSRHQIDIVARYAQLTCLRQDVPRLLTQIAGLRKELLTW